MGRLWVNSYRCHRFYLHWYLVQIDVAGRDIHQVCVSKEIVVHAGPRLRAYLAWNAVVVMTPAMRQTDNPGTDIVTQFRRCLNCSHAGTDLNHVAVRYPAFVCVSRVH